MSNYFEEDDDKEGSEGKSGEIRKKFNDPTSVGRRDDMLPQSEINQKLLIHEDANKSSVRKQRDKRKDLQAIKEKRPTQAKGIRGGVARGASSSSFKTHPLAQTAQFSGQEQKVLPNDVDHELNEDQQNELANRPELTNRLEHQHRNVPKFHPTLRPRGS